MNNNNIDYSIVLNKTRLNVDELLLIETYINYRILFFIFFLDLKIYLWSKTIRFKIRIFVILQSYNMCI